MLWLAVILLGIGVVASLWPREYPQGHQKFGQRYCYPVFAVLAGFPAMFLITTHFAHVSGLASTVFWLTWLITLIVVAAVTRKGGFWGALLALLAAMAFVLLPLSSNFGSSAPAPKASAQQNVGGAKAQAQASPGTGKVPTTCKTQFKQAWDPNTDYRLVSTGLWTNPVTHTITVKGAEARQTAMIGHDARYLASSAWVLGMWNDPNNVAPLLTPDKGCLSVQGTNLYDKVTATWKTAKASIAQAPASGVNTGSEGGKFVANAAGGITGNLTAIKRDYPSGKSTYDLARCGNHVLPGHPTNVPPGKVNTPPPSTPPTKPPTTPPTTKPPTTPPTTPTPTPSTSTPTPTPSTTTPTPTPTTPTPSPTCPSGQVGTPPNCLATKNPSQNVPGPSGKPTAPAPSGPAESSPPVETSPAQPSTTPGSGVTGLPAPGASQTTQPATPAPTITGAPSSGAPGTGSGNPDGGNTAAGLLAPFGLMGGALWRRKRLGV